MHFSDKLLFLFCSINSCIATKECYQWRSSRQEKRSKQFSWTYLLRWKCTERVTRGISFLLEEGRLSPDTGSPDTQTRRHGRRQPPSSSAQVQLLRSVSVRGRSVTSAVSFFFFLLITIIIIIIIIIIFIIITNTVSHLSTPENKLIHSLSCGANLVGLTCIAFSPSPL